MIKIDIKRRVFRLKIMEAELKKVVQNYIEIYQQNIKSSYPSIHMKDLQKIWIETNQTLEKKGTVDDTKSLGKKKKTAYQNFFVTARQKLTDNNPNLKFGEISKLVSAEWSNMSVEDKKKYENENVKKEDAKKYNDNSFMDFFESNTEKDTNFRFEFENDAIDEEESILEEELEGDDEEDDVYFDEENTFEMDD